MTSRGSDTAAGGSAVPGPSNPPSIAQPSAKQRWRLRFYPLAALVVLFTVVVVAALVTTPGEGRIGGDYPAFYAAGEIASDGNWAQLYDPATQQEVQAGLVDDKGGFLYFAYPPFVAAIYGVMTGLGYTASFLLQVALMALALGIALRFMRFEAPVVSAFPVAAYTLALFFYPMLRAVIGGQNTALTLALIAAAAWAEANNRDWMAGAAIGFLFYKPQFAVPFILLLLVARRWKALTAAVGTGAILWGTSALLMGSGWMIEWWDEASSFAETNADVNGHLFISLPGVLDQIAGGSGVVIGWALAAVVAGLMAVIWFRLGAARPWVRYGLAAAGIALVVPQALFYEAGLLVLPLGLLWSWRREERTGVWILWASAWTQPLAGSLRFSPLFVTVLATFVWFICSERAVLQGSSGGERTTSV